MARHWKRNGLILVLGAFLFSCGLQLGLRLIDRGKGALFVEAHIWLFIFFPLVAVGVVVFLRGLYLERKS